MPHQPSEDVCLAIFRGLIIAEIVMFIIALPLGFIAGAMIESGLQEAGLSMG